MCVFVHVCVSVGVCVCEYVKGLAWLCRRVFDGVCVVLVLSATATLPVNDVEDRYMVLTDIPTVPCHYTSNPFQSEPTADCHLHDSK